MPRGIPKNGVRAPRQSKKNGVWTLPTRWRGAAEARAENPGTVFHASEDLAERARLEGLKEGLELLERIRKAGSNRRALRACRFERDS